MSALLAEDHFLMLVREAFDVYMMQIYPQQSFFTPLDAAVAVGSFCGLSVEAAINHMRLPNVTELVNRFTLLKECERILLQQERQRQPLHFAAAAGTPLFVPAAAVNHLAVPAQPSSPNQPPPLLVGKPSTPLARSRPSTKMRMVQLGETPNTPRPRSLTRPPTSPSTIRPLRCFAAATITKSGAVERSPNPVANKDANGVVGVASPRSDSRATVNDAWGDEATTVCSPVAPDERAAGGNRSPSPMPPAPSKLSNGRGAVAPITMPTVAERASAAAGAGSTVTPKFQKSNPPMNDVSSGLKVCKQFARAGTCSFGSRCLYHHLADGSSPGGLTSHSGRTPTTTTPTTTSRSSTAALSIGAPSSRGTPRRVSSNTCHTSFDDAVMADGCDVCTAAAFTRSPQGLRCAPPSHRSTPNPESDWSRCASWSTERDRRTRCSDVCRNSPVPLGIMGRAVHNEVAKRVEEDQQQQQQAGGWRTGDGCEQMPSPRPVGRTAAPNRKYTLVVDNAETL